MQLTGQEVQAITGLAQDDISRLQFEAAYEWLQFIGCDAYGLEHIPRTKEFWSFWRNEWYKIDREFLRHYLQWGYSNTREWYGWFHSVAADHDYLNSTVIHAAYHRVVKDLAIKR